MNLIPAFIRRRIEHRPNLVKIVDNIGWLFLDQILRMGVGLLVGVWVARYLGPEQFGLLNFALAFTVVFATLAHVGLYNIVIRDIARDPDGASLTLGTAATLQMVGGLLGFLLTLGAITWARPDDPLARSIVAILGAIMLFRASDTALCWFESQVQSKYTVWVQNGVFLVFAAVKVALILGQASLTAFAWVMLAEAVLVAVILLLVMGKYGPALSGLRVSWLRAKTLLQDSWPQLITVIGISIYMKIDQLMLGHMINDKAVGIYTAAVRITEIWYFIPMIITASVFPAILNSKERSPDEYIKRMSKLLKYLVLLALLVTIPVALFSSDLVVMLFGVQYYAAGSILAIYIWTSIFVFLAVGGSKWYLAEGFQKIHMIHYLIGAFINVILNLILIPKYGIYGAAMATVVSHIYLGLLADLLFKKTRVLFKMKIKALIIT